MIRNLAAVLVFDKRTILERAFKKPEKQDLVYIVREGDKVPDRSKTQKEVSRINFQNPGNVGEIFQNFAEESGGKVEYIPPFTFLRIWV